MKLFILFERLFRVIAVIFEVMLTSVSSKILGTKNLGDWDAEIDVGESLRLFLCLVLWLWVG